MKKCVGSIGSFPIRDLVELKEREGYQKFLERRGDKVFLVETPLTDDALLDIINCEVVAVAPDDLWSLLEKGSPKKTVSKPVATLKFKTSFGWCEFPKTSRQPIDDLGLEEIVW